jgi:hypothetical protein
MTVSPRKYRHQALRPEPMRVSVIAVGIAALLAGEGTEAAVVQQPDGLEIEGVLDGGIIAPLATGDTMDYLTFEILEPGEVTFASGFGSSLLVQLASFIGAEDEFGFLGNPYRLEQMSEEPATFTRVLGPGIYVTAMGVRENTSYDVFDGYKPVNEEGGGFTFGPYSYSIDGSVRALEFREGNLDGTFTITQIPEPRTILLLVASMAVLVGRRRKDARGLQDGAGQPATRAESK